MTAISTEHVIEQHGWSLSFAEQDKEMDRHHDEEHQFPAAMALMTVHHDHDPDSTPRR